MGQSILSLPIDMESHGTCPMGHVQWDRFHGTCPTGHVPRGLDMSHGTCPMGRHPLGCPWAPFGRHLGPFRPPLGLLWPSWGSLGAPGSIWAPSSEQMLLKYRACAQNQASRLPRNPRNSPWNPRNSAELSGVRNCRSDPTSTRAGGQDDVSYTNSLKQD